MGAHKVCRDKDSGCEAQVITRIRRIMVRTEVPLRSGARLHLCRTAERAQQELAEALMLYANGRQVRGKAVLPTVNATESCLFSVDSTQKSGICVNYESNGLERVSPHTPGSFTSYEL